MRTLIFDQFEFDNPLTEEHLEVSIASRGSFPFPTASSFIAACVGVDATEEIGLARQFSENFGYGFIRKYLLRFASVSIPNDCTWPCYVLADGPDEWHVVIETPKQFISYCWSTSA